MAIMLGAAGPLPRPPQASPLSASPLIQHHGSAYVVQRSRRRVNCSPWLPTVNTGGQVVPTLCATRRGESGSPSPPLEPSKDAEFQWQTLEQARDGLAHISTPVQVLTALRRVQALNASCQHQSAQSAYLADILPQLSHLLLQHAESFRAKDLVKAITTLGSLRGCEPGVIIRLCDRLKGHVAAASPSSLVDLITVFAHLGLRPVDTLLAEMLHCLEGSLSSMSAHQLVQLLRSLVRLGMRPPTPWLYAWEDASRAELQDMSSQELSQVVWSLSEISFSPGAAWMAGFLGVCHIRLPQATGQQLTELMAGLGRLGAAPLVSAAWKAQVLQVSLALMPQLAASELVRLLVGAATLQLQPDSSWVCVAAARGMKVMRSCNPRDLLDLLNALIRLDPPAQAQTGRHATATSTVPGGRSQLQSAPAQHLQQVSVQGVDVVQGPPALSSHPLGPRLPASFGAINHATHITTSHPTLNAIPASSSDSDATVGMTNGATRDHAAFVPPAVSHVQGSAAPAMEATTSAYTTRPPKWCSYAWKQEFLAASAAVMSRFTAPGLVSLLHDVVLVGARPTSGWISQYASVLLDKVDVLGAAELCTLATAMSKVWRKYLIRQQLAQRLVESSTSKLGLMTGAQLLSLAQDLCAMSSLVDAAWRKAFLSNSQQRVSAMSYEQLACLPYLAIKLDLQPGLAWWSALYAAMQAPHHDVRQLDINTLSNLLWGVTMSAVPPPQPWLESVMQEARRKVAEGKSRGAGELPWQAGGRSPHGDAPGMGEQRQGRGYAGSRQRDRMNGRAGQAARSGKHRAKQRDPGQQAEVTAA